MQALPVVRASAFRPVVAKLERMGAPAQAHLDRVGVPFELVEAGDAVVPETPLWALFDRVREREGVADVGFQIGASHRVTDIENVAPVVAGHPTLLRTAEAFCALLQSHANYWDFWMEQYPGGARVCRRGSPIAVGRWPVEQYVVSFLVDLVHMAAPAWWPREIWLQADVALLPAERAWLRDARVHLGSPVTAISVPDSLLAARPDTNGQNGPDAADPNRISREFLPAFREVVQSHLPLGRARLGGLSRAYGVHTRTLQRHLTRAGTSFQQVLEEVRRSLALARLEETDQPISEIALDLGYQEFSAFTHAFRRWTSVSPRAYRSANRRSPGVAP